MEDWGVNRGVIWEANDFPGNPGNPELKIKIINLHQKKPLTEDSQRGTMWEANDLNPELKIKNYKPILCNIIDGIISFNNDCKTGIDLDEIRILKASPCLLMVHFKLYLVFSTLIRLFTSSRLKEFVEIIIARFVLQKLPSSQIQ